MAYQTSTNLYTNTKYVVDAAGGTPYTTIQSAINAANTAGIPATIYIREGVYTENLTLYGGLNLEGSENSAVTIAGKHTPPTAGNLNFNRIGFSSGTHVLDDSVNAGTTLIKFSRCVFAITNGYACNLTNWTGNITFKYCTESSTTSGIVNNAGTAPVSIYNSVLGAGTAKPLTVNGVLEVFNGKILCPITIAGSAASIIEGGSTIYGTITTSATAALVIRNSTISTGSTTAISHSSGTTLLLNNVVIDTTNATAISGTGSVSFNEATFVNSNVLAGTITQVLTGVVKTGEIYANINVVTSGFSGMLSAADSNVQQALTDIDLWGKTTTNHALLLGRGTGTAIGSLTIGTTGQLLTGVSANDPTWTTATYPATIATGDVVIGTGTNQVGVVATAGGTSGYVLTAQGSGVAPIWVAASSGGGITFSSVTSTPLAAAVNNGYINKYNAAQLVINLPATAAVGSIIAIVGFGVNGWKIVPNYGASQQIWLNSSETTAGTGYLASTFSTNCVELICTQANLQWIVRSSSGNITVV